MGRDQAGRKLAVVPFRGKEGYLRQGTPSDACGKPDAKQRACLVPLDATQRTEDTNAIRYVRLSSAAYPYNQPRCPTITTEILEIGDRVVRSWPTGFEPVV